MVSASGLQHQLRCYAGAQRKREPVKAASIQKRGLPLKKIQRIVGNPIIFHGIRSFAEHDTRGMPCVKGVRDSQRKVLLLAIHSGLCLVDIRPGRHMIAAKLDVESPRRC